MFQIVSKHKNQQDQLTEYNVLNTTNNLTTANAMAKQYESTLDSKFEVLVWEILYTNPLCTID